MKADMKVKLGALPFFDARNWGLGLTLDKILTVYKSSSKGRIPTKYSNLTLQFLIKYCVFEVWFGELME